MSNRAPVGIQNDAINRFYPFVQTSFDLNRMDAFVNSLGVDFIHFKAMPSPIGKKDVGDLRRNDGVDTITSNGMIYRCAGRFTATITDNTRDQKRNQGGVEDPSESRLVMPRFYNKTDVDDGCRIYMAPGDRIYIADPNADVLVSNYQEMTYKDDIDNEPMFPVCKLEQNLLDSRNIEYFQGVDFNLTNDGNIRWIAGGRNPGIDPDTGMGRIYSMRYLYKAYWYVISLPKEIRITNVTTNGVRSPERMPYHAVIVREYIYRNKNHGNKTDQNVVKGPDRSVPTPNRTINPGQYQVPVDMTGIDDTEESQS